MRLCKQKTTKVTPTEAHFGKSCDTPLSIMPTTADSKNLNNTKPSINV